MISAHPHPFGTPEFRPVAVGLAQRSTVADGFRPVVVGQSPRSPFDAPSVELIHLEPPSSRWLAATMTVNLSPRFIWKLMSAGPENPSPAPRREAPSTAPGAASRRVPEVVNHTLIFSTNDRFERLETLIRQPAPEVVAAPTSPRGHRAEGDFSPERLALRREPGGAAADDRGDGLVRRTSSTPFTLNIEFPTSPVAKFTRRVAEILAFEKSMAARGGITGVGAMSARAARVSQREGAAPAKPARGVGFGESLALPNAFAPDERRASARRSSFDRPQPLIVCSLNQPPILERQSGWRSRGAGGPPTVEWLGVSSPADPRPNRPRRDRGVLEVSQPGPAEIFRWAASRFDQSQGIVDRLRLAPRRDRQSPDWLAGPMARAEISTRGDVGMWNQPAWSSAIPTRAIQTRAGLMTTVVDRAIANSTATAGARSGESASPPLGGAASAGTFATALAARLARSVDPRAEPVAPRFVARSAAPVGEPPRPASPNPSPWMASVSAPAMVQSRTSFDLPPGLVQTLTDRVVGALDARTLAARERMGRF